jgi:hypothetical protein
MSDSNFDGPDYLEGFTFEDYAKKAEAARNPDGIEEELQEASEQQEERKTSTPETDWEKRYKDLEQHNSRQAQELGQLRTENTQYRTAFDENLLGPTTETKDDTEENEPITSNDLFENPDAAFNRAIDNHPAIKEAKERADEAQRQAILRAKSEFEEAHPNYQETMSEPEFAEWIRENNTRLTLAQRADQWDFSAADALFSLYESEQKTVTIQNQQEANEALEQAELESAGVGEPPPDVKYSRSKMLEYMIDAKRGDEKAERYLNTHIENYRHALAAGEVTD